MTYLATNVFLADGAKTFWDFSFAGVSPDSGSGTLPYLYAADVKALELYKDAEGNAASAERVVFIDPALPLRANIVGLPVAAGRQVKIYRSTEIRFPLVDYRDRQAVTEFDLDLANRQAVFIAQETQDAASNNMALDKNENYDVKGRRIVNLAPGVDDGDAINLGQLRHSVRVPDSYTALLPIPETAGDRAGRLLTFDALGNPVARFLNSGSAVELELALANTTDPTKGASKIGLLGGGTVQDLALLRPDLADPSKGAALVALPGGGTVADLDHLRDSDDIVDPSKGAAKVGRAIRYVVSMSELRSLNGQYDGEVVYLRGYYANFRKGGGNFVWSSTSTVADDSGTIIKAVAATGRWIRQFERLYVSYFGAVPDTGADRSVALQAARDYLQAQLLPSWLGFEAGRYTYSVAQNWAINDAQIVFEGEVRLQYSGTGAAVLLDGQNNGGNIYRMQFGWGNQPIIEAPATAGDGVYLSSVHHSKVGAYVVGCGPAGAGLRIKFAVCTTFDIRVSKNPDGGWYSTTAPGTGVYADELNPGELCSYCTFNVPILEHLPIGMYMNNAFGNSILGGTFEGCNIGQFMSINAFNNKTCYVDFEVNADHDVYCLGRENFWLYCDTEKQITFDGTAVNNYVVGGAHSDILANTNTRHNVVQDLVYNRYVDNSAITDFSGGKLLRHGNINRGIGRVEVNGILTTDNIAVTPTTPGIFTYTHTGLQNIRVGVVGGDVSLITITRNGVTLGTGQTTGLFTLGGADAINVTHGLTVPNMYILT